MIFHEGVDLQANFDPVLAAADGTAFARTQRSKTNPSGPPVGYGHYLIVFHFDGSKTVYAHLSDYITASGPVGKGKSIAISGQSGVGTGPHLHFEFIPSDPIPPRRGFPQGSQVGSIRRPISRS